MNIKNVYILEDRAILYLNGEDTKEFLQNLISNAIHYSNENGNVILRFISLNQSIIIEVEDDGIGIEEVNFSRLFDMSMWS